MFFTSCYNRQLITVRLPVDSAAVEMFNRKILARFSDYRDSSDNYVNPPGFISRLGLPIYGLVYLNKEVEKHDIILYSFDGKDSCILFSDTLKINAYELPLSSIPALEGYYFIKDAKDSTRYIRPPNQALKLNGKPQVR